MKKLFQRKFILVLLLIVACFVLAQSLHYFSNDRPYCAHPQGSVSDIYKETRNIYVNVEKWLPISTTKFLQVSNTQRDEKLLNRMGVVSEEDVYSFVENGLVSSFEKISGNCQIPHIQRQSSKDASRWLEGSVFVRVKISPSTYDSAISYSITLDVRRLVRDRVLGYDAVIEIPYDATRAQIKQLFDFIFSGMLPVTSH